MLIITKLNNNYNSIKINNKIIISIIIWNNN